MTAAIAESVRKACAAWKAWRYRQTLFLLVSLKCLNFRWARPEAVCDQPMTRFLYSYPSPLVYPRHLGRRRGKTCLALRMRLEGGFRGERWEISNKTLSVPGPMRGCIPEGLCWPIISKPKEGLSNPLQAKGIASIRESFVSF